MPSWNTSSGLDGIGVSDIKKTPNYVILAILNLFLYNGSIPDFLLRSRTTLIPKKPDSIEPADFRPITVSSVRVRLYHKILANRLLRIADVDERQRAF